MIIIKRDGLYDVNEGLISPEDLSQFMHSPIKTSEPISLIDLLSYIWNSGNEQAYSVFFNFNPADLFDRILEVEEYEEYNKGRSEQEYDRIEVSLITDIIIKDKAPAKVFSIIDVSGVKGGERYSIETAELDTLIHTPVVIANTSDLSVGWPKHFKGIKVTTETNITVLQFLNAIISEITREQVEEMDETAGEAEEEQRDVHEALPGDE